MPSCSEKNKNAEHYRVECFRDENPVIIKELFPLGTSKEYIDYILINRAYFEASEISNNKYRYDRYEPFRYNSYIILVVYVDGKSSGLWYGSRKLY